MIDHINCPLFQVLRKHNIPSCELDFHHGKNEFSLNYFYDQKRYSFKFNITRQTIETQWYLVVNQAKFNRFITDLNITIESLTELEKDLIILFTTYKLKARVNYQYNINPIIFMTDLLDELKWVANHLVSISDYSICIEEREQGGPRHYYHKPNLRIEIPFKKEVQIKENNQLPILVQSFLVESNLKVQDLMNMAEKIREFAKSGLPNNYRINFMYESKI